MTTIQPWHTQAERVVYQDCWIHVVLAEVMLPSGQAYTYTVVRRLPGAAVVAMNVRGDVLVQREYRYPLDAVIHQLPGGLVEPGETPLETARRELAEEAGFEAEVWEELGVVQDNPGLLDGQTTIFLARGVHSVGSTRPDRAEFVAHEWRSPHWLRERIRAGEVQDRVLLAAFAMLVARSLVPFR